MALYSWPTSLPDKPLKQGFEESPPNTRVRTEMGVGPAKMRRRATAGVRVFKVNFLLTETQVQTLDDFVMSTLGGGLARFDWTHPRTGASAEFRFRELPTYQPALGDRYRATATLELMP